MQFLNEKEKEKHKKIKGRKVDFPQWSHQSNVWVLFLTSTKVPT